MGLFMVMFSSYLFMGFSSSSSLLPGFYFTWTVFITIFSNTYNSIRNMSFSLKKKKKESKNSTLTCWKSSRSRLVTFLWLCHLLLVQKCKPIKSSAEKQKYCLLCWNYAIKANQQVLRAFKDGLLFKKDWLSISSIQSSWKIN